ncbi:MAG TPA: hypothetical protein VN578_14190 [Candidatus Binatia bacterium]|jgi:hypothetical protein|nr:hypothetical protein [Candidatus Binatia bacterium]
MKGPIERLASRARRVCCTCLPLLVAGLMMPGTTRAIVYNLSNGNSTATLNAGTSAGLNSWTVDGINQLNQQWYWFRIGSGGPQADLSAITTTPYVTTLGSSMLTALYTNAQYGVQVNYTLTGQSAGSGKSGLNETVRAYNFTSSTQAFHLFMYSDMNLGHLSANQSVALGNDGHGDSTSVQTFGSPVGGSNTWVTSTLANHLEAAGDHQTLTELTTVNNLQLNDNANTGPGYPATWAFEWDLTLAPNTSTGISMLDTLSVPELSTSTFITLGFGAWLFRLRRQYQKTT